MSDRVRRVPLEAIKSLRVEVLRRGTPVTHCDYPEDALPDAVHLAIERNGEIVATSTWFSRECPERAGVPAMQLKGMAVRESLQGEGLGALLIEEGIALAVDRRASITWARARDSALGFYTARGFTVIGDGFIDEPTAMPHHIVIRSV